MNNRGFFTMICSFNYYLKIEFDQTVVMNLNKNYLFILRPIY